MTAEVAILNKNAVALAADSAVTVGSQKIYNSALKLFTLSKVAPVAVMVYGNAMLLGMPWETIIKCFREKQKSKTYPTVAEYADALLSFIPNQTSMFPKASQDEWAHNCAASYLVTVIIKQISDEVQAYIGEHGEIEASKVTEITEAVINEHYNMLKDGRKVDGITKEVESSVLKQYAKRYTFLIDEHCKQFDLKVRYKTKLRRIFAWLHTRDIFTEDYSGVVIAGFGEEEFLPSLLTFKIDGIVQNRLIYTKVEEKSRSISRTMSAAIVPFAQDDMVATFMAGVNSQVNLFLHAYLGKVFDGIIGIIPDDVFVSDRKAVSRFKKKFSGQLEKLAKDFFEQLEKHKRANHVNPVMTMVQVLPKDELAAMAESLVNLTAFKRRMTTSLETVGGPIDVAVISKGDGLVWVKRKLYFPAELNYGFHSNYMRGL